MVWLRVELPRERDRQIDTEREDTIFMKPTPAPQAKKRTKEKQNLKKKNIGQVSTREREREDGISVET